MKFKISSMTASMLADHAKLPPELAEQIAQAPSKADFLYLSAPPHVVEKALSGLQTGLTSDDIRISTYARDLALKEISKILAQLPC